MNLLFISDVNAKPGRKILTALLPGLREEFRADLVVANVENAAHGLGVTAKIADELLEIGVDVMTGGNHLFDRRDILDYLPTQPRLLRAANYSPEVPGFSHYIGEAGGAGYFVAALTGRVFMPPLDCPFRTFDRLVEKEASGIAVRIIDFHAEATSEKVAFGRYADGRAGAVIGTHTHVQTADERVLPGGTAYITDAGMTGPHDGVIGMAYGSVVPRFLTGLPTRFEPAAGDVLLQAVAVDIDEKTGLARSITRISRSDE